MVASTVSENVSLNKFIFFTIGVGMELQPIIMNVFRISITYFAWLMMQEHRYHIKRKWTWNQNRHLNTSKEPKPTLISLVAV
jgi:hypothetical protein